RTFGVFLSSASRWMYDPSAVTARLASEMSETVRGRPLEDDDVDLRMLGRFLTAIDRKAREAGRPYYIVMDGLEEIPPPDRAVVQQLLGLLPFGYPGFRFLLSGDLNALPLAPVAREKTKSWQLPFFRREEAATYLAGLQL